MALAFGIDAVMPGLSERKASKRFCFVRSPPMSASACGSTVMEDAVGTKPVAACVRW
jgi:hypothetical protein